MVIYDVSMQVNPDVHEGCVRWMIEEHIPEVLKYQGFVKAELLLEPEGRSRIRVLYYLQTQDQLESYLKLHSPVMRAKTKEKWGLEVSAERTTWALYGTLNAPK